MPSSAGPATESARSGITEERRACRIPGFTLVELLVVLVVLAVVAAVVLPKFADSRGRANEAKLRSDLRLLRDAVDRHCNDTGVWPRSLRDLTAVTAPARGIDSNGAPAPIAASDWHGPYIDSVPENPITHDNYFYGVSPPDVGVVRGGVAAGASASGPN